MALSNDDKQKLYQLANLQKSKEEYEKSYLKKSEEQDYNPKLKECIICGRMIPYDSLICPYCGQKISVIKVQNVSNDREVRNYFKKLFFIFNSFKKRKFLVIIIVLVILGVFCLVGFERTAPKRIVKDYINQRYDYVANIGFYNYDLSDEYKKLYNTIVLSETDWSYQILNVKHDGSTAIVRTQFIYPDYAIPIKDSLYSLSIGAYSSMLDGEITEEFLNYVDSIYSTTKPSNTDKIIEFNCYRSGLKWNFEDTDDGRQNLGEVFVGNFFEAV